VLSAGISNLALFLFLRLLQAQIKMYDAWESASEEPPGRAVSSFAPSTLPSGRVLTHYSDERHA
jgi:hypothetical protein